MIDFRFRRLHRAPLGAAFLLAASALLTGCNTVPPPATSTSPRPTAAARPALQPRADDDYTPREHRRHHRAVAADDTPGQFDYYLLNLSWSPEYCVSHRSAPECAAHSTFVLHGLWPQNANGTYPEDCSSAPGPSNPGQYSDLYPSPGLLEHEWQQHGTCSGLGPDQFFSDARTALHSVAVPPALGNLSQPTSLPAATILGLFTAANPGIPGSSLALSCGNNYLTAVEVCLDKNLHPTSCGQVNSCSANTIRIVPPQS